MDNKVKVSKHSHIPVIQIYDGQIADMRREGHTLQQIGDIIGTTRERVRQILNEYYPDAKTTLLSEAKVAKIIGCSFTYLGTLRKQGKLQPKRGGRRLWLYDRNEIERAMLVIHKLCTHCGEPIPINSALRKYCRKCNIESRRYNYPFLSDEGREKASKATDSWRKRNPERLREIQGKAVRKYQNKRSKEHFANTRYIVVGGNAPSPKGFIFRAVACKNSHLILEDGLEIPVSCVRMIKNGQE